MSKQTLPERIDAALAKRGGRASFFDLAMDLYPDRQSWRYQSNGGPPGCYMALSAGLRRGGFFVSGEAGSGNKTVWARTPA